MTKIDKLVDRYARAASKADSAFKALNKEVEKLLGDGWHYNSFESDGAKRRLRLVELGS